MADVRRFDVSDEQSIGGRTGEGRQHETRAPVAAA
jgi:hypothetical protein